ncbi:MAG: FtsH protease activity modulator HflK [Burkholderiaceae bacterium]
MPKPLRALLNLNDPGWGRNQNNDNNNGQRPGGNNDGPPDLDELWRDLNRKLNNLFGRRGGGGAPPGGGGDGPTLRGAGIGLGVLALVAALLWLGSGFYIVREGQSSVVLRFGKFVKQIDQAGFTWRLPYPFEAHEIVNTSQLRTVEVGYRNGVRNKNLRESLMLTRDQSIVDMQFAIQYRVGEPRNYLFNNRMGAVPEEIVRGAGEAAMAEIVGRTGIDQVLFEEKELVATTARSLIQAILDRYGSGVTIVDVTIQQVQPPEQVQAAFEDANKAAQDRVRLINEGEAYANDLIPRAEGAGARVLEEANGYRASIVAAAEGDAARFTSLLNEYEKAPKVTRDRLYLETMQEVMSKTSKVYMNSNSNNNVMYLPLDKILQQGSGLTEAAAAAAARLRGNNDSGGQSRANSTGVAGGAVNGLNVRDRETLRRTRDRDIR